jgi:hypothetical protein
MKSAIDEATLAACATSGRLVSGRTNDHEKGDANMTRIVTSLRLANWRLALLGAVTCLLLGALPSSAQDVCGDLEDMTEETLDLYIDELNEEWDVDLNDGDLCTKLTENFIKGCQTAVKDAAKCIQNQIKALSKQNQTACKALAGSEASACSASYKDEAKSDSDEVADFARAESDDCETFAAEDYFDVCMFGF